MSDTSDQMWTTIAAERRALATDLDGLTDAQWDTPSLNEGWSVRDTLAHMAGTAQMTPAGFFLEVAKNRGFGKMIDAKIAQNRGATPAEALATFRSLADSRGCPPGPKTSWLGETIVHAEDIRRPLGIRHDYPMDAVVQVADFYKGSNALLGTKKRIAGLHLEATDTAWEHGEGAPVEGPMLSLLMAMTGRSAALSDLTGAGVDTLRARS